MKIREIKMQIELEDGEIVQVSVHGEGCQRWGADRAHIAETVDITERLIDGVPEDNGWTI